jgi:hypothetical protein
MLMAGIDRLPATILAAIVAEHRGWLLDVFKLEHSRNFEPRRGRIMTTDRYTKTVLTVIAAALLALVAQNAIHSAVAQSDIQKVQLCDPMHCADVRLMGYTATDKPSWGIYAVGASPRDK